MKTLVTTHVRSGTRRDLKYLAPATYKLNVSEKHLHVNQHFVLNTSGRRHYTIGYQRLSVTRNTLILV